MYVSVHDVGDVYIFCLVLRYYACLCGHEELVQYLLANGKRCVHHQYTLHVQNDIHTLFDLCVLCLSFLWQGRNVRRTRLTASAACTGRWATPSAACSRSTSVLQLKLCKEITTTSSYRRKTYAQKHKNTKPLTFPKSLIYFLLCFRLLEQGNYSDVTFMVHGEMFKAHRCVLSARSEYFAHMLETKWKGKSAIPLKHPLVGYVSLHTTLQVSKAPL